MNEKKGSEDSGSKPKESQSTSLLASKHEQPDVPRRSWNPFTMCLKFRRKMFITVEPVLFLYMFGLYLLLSVEEQYIFNRLGREECITELNFTEPFNFCMSTGALNKFIGRGTGNKVEAETSFLDLYVGVAGQLPSIFAALFYGPFSDRIGRRPIMLIYIAMAACLTGVVTLIIMYLNLTLFLLIPLALVNALAGSLPGMLTAVYSYIADVSSKKWLTLRIGILESMIFIGGTISLALSGQWLLKTSCNFEGAIWMYLACNLIIVVYVLLWLPESQTKLQQRERMKNRPSGFRIFIRG